MEFFINRLHKAATFTGKRGKIHKCRVSNIGTETTINFIIQGHRMILVEAEGAPHTLQESYESIDVHPGQSVAVLVTLHGAPKDLLHCFFNSFYKACSRNYWYSPLC